MPDKKGVVPEKVFAGPTTGEDFTQTEGYKSWLKLLNSVIN